MPQGVAATEEQVATALAAREMGMTQRVAASLARASQPAVQRWEGEKNGTLAKMPAEDVQRLVSREKNRIATRFLKGLDGGLDRVEAEIKEMNPYQAGILACAFADKLLLLAGQPTAIIQHVGEGLAQSDEEVQALEVLAGMLARRMGAIDAEVLGELPESSDGTSPVGQPSASCDNDGKATARE